MEPLPADTLEREPTEPALRERLTEQRRAFMERPPRVAVRLDALERLARVLVRRADDIVAAVSEDFGGRAAEETRALEIVPLLNEIRSARRHLPKWARPRRAPVQWQTWPAKARIIYQPLGVVGILSPWNFPFFLTLGPLVGAIAAGNHVLVKPSELSPASAAMLTEVLAEVFPSQYVSVVTGGVETGSAFARLPFDHLLFTGSTRVGRLVMKAASENLVPVTLELGGKSAVIVHESYPMAKAAVRIATGKLYNAGQTCIAPDYVLVPRHCRDEFVAETRRTMATLHPRLAGPDYTRIINARHYRRLSGLLEDAKQRGAAVIPINEGGDGCNELNRVFPPTIVTGLTDAMALAHEEIFGPILPVLDYDSMDEAIAYVNARPHPLAFYYFDHNAARAGDVVDSVTAGGVTVNDCIFHVGQPALPFGGVGASGMGRYHGFDGFEAFSHKKGILWQRRWTPLSLLRPPYGAAVRRVTTSLLRLS